MSRLEQVDYFGLPIFKLLEFGSPKSSIAGAFLDSRNLIEQCPTFLAVARLYICLDENHERSVPAVMCKPLKHQPIRLTQALDHFYNIRDHAVGDKQPRSALGWASVSGSSFVIGSVRLGVSPISARPFGRLRRRTGNRKLCPICERALDHRAWRRHPSQVERPAPAREHIRQQDPERIESGFGQVRLSIR